MRQSHPILPLSAFPPAPSPSPDRPVPRRLLPAAGGHGVGWSEIQRYSFKVPKNWEETPVSIADLGGTEIDLR